MTEGLDLDEVGPPRIDAGETLKSIVARVTAAGVSLDQVVVAGTSCDGCGADLYLDWAKNWPDGIALDESEKGLAPEEIRRRREEAVADKERREAEAAERAAEAERVMSDSLEGW